MRGAERVIVVLGTSHSGTTVLAYILNTHPQVRLIIDGENPEVLESDILMRRDWQTMQYLLDWFPEDYLVFKHPWAQENTTFFAEHLRDATYLYCWRPFEDVRKSWRRFGGPSPYQGMGCARDVHKLHTALARWFPLVVQPRMYLCLRHNEIVLEPGKTMTRVAEAIGIAPTFDLSIVEPDAHWDKRLQPVPVMENA
jgi:hypothetical protein